MNRNRYPLRSIVDSPDYYHETLECGHTIVRPTDIYGTTNAARRRCRQCFKGAALGAAPTPEGDSK